MKEHIRSLINWIGRLFKKEESPKYTTIDTFRSFDIRFKKVSCRADLPIRWNFDTIYIIGDKGYEWMIGFKCPCGCKDVIHLNLLQDCHPCWNYTFSEFGEVSVYPSIKRKRKCYSHFTIRNNHVNWIMS